MADTKPTAEHDQDWVVVSHDKEHEAVTLEEHRYVADSKSKSAREGKVHNDTRHTSNILNRQQSVSTHKI